MKVIHCVNIMRSDHLAEICERRSRNPLRLMLCVGASWCQTSPPIGAPSTKDAPPREWRSAVAPAAEVDATRAKALAGHGLVALGHPDDARNKGRSARP